MDEKITTYKGTNKDMQCRGFQYEIGKTVESEWAIRCGNRGFHSCEVPMDVLSYYGQATGSRYFECEASGKIDKPKPDSGEDSKIASSELKLKAEIGLAGIIKAQIDFVKKWAKGNIAQGDRGHAEVHGKDAIAASFGIEGAALGELGDWIVCAEWEREGYPLRKERITNA